MIEGELKIIKESRQGNSASFGKLYDEYHVPIYRFIYLKVSQKEEAEDLTHQVFLSAWQSIHRYKITNLPFSSWLYRIARNKVIDYYRTAKDNLSLETLSQHFSHSDSPAHLTPTLTSNSIETDVSNSLIIDNIKSALANLNPEQQDVLVMRFVEDMPIKEVAKVINKSEGAIKLIQHRAVNKLKTILIAKNYV